MTGRRLVFNQADSWRRHGTPAQHICAYSEEHCCYCGKPVKPGAPRLALSRTDGGEWWLVVPGEPTQPDEGDFGRFTLPVGPGCLKRHPEWRFAVVPVPPADSVPSGGVGPS